MSNGNREKLSSNLVKSLKQHFQQLADPNVATYTVERQKTTFPKAKSDLVIFNSAGTVVIKGREFGGGQTSLWLS